MENDRKKYLGVAIDSASLQNGENIQNILFKKSVEVIFQKQKKNKEAMKFLENT